MTNTATDRQRFCNEWLAAWTGNRPATLLAFYTEDAFYLDPANPNGMKGHKEMLPYFEKLLSRNPDWRWESEELFTSEKGFILKWKATIPVKGTSLILHGLDIIEMRGMQINRNEVYFDRVKWLELMKAGSL